MSWIVIKLHELVVFNYSSMADKFIILHLLLACFINLLTGIKNPNETSLPSVNLIFSLV